MAKDWNFGDPAFAGWGGIPRAGADSPKISDIFGAEQDAFFLNLPAGTDRAPVALAAADKKAAADLADRAVPTDANWLKDLFSGIGNQGDERETDLSDAGIDTLDYAFAKPATKGGKGRGKDKNNGGTDTDGTDTGGTDTGGTDTGGTDTGGSDGGETNPGSSDANTYVSGLDTPDGFNIEIVFDGEWTEARKLGFYTVSERISDIITGDIAAHNGIDDVRISATMTTIDGNGGYWGWGGYSSVRPDSHLPSTGYMRFDVADADNVIAYGLWEDVIFHEMLHALGFGTGWNAMGLVRDYSGDLRFTGANAIQAYNDGFADIAALDPLSAFGVPIETDGGSGTAGVHWDDATFPHEIMTGTLRGTNDVSDMTIAALQDMGYETVYGDSVLVG